MSTKSTQAELQEQEELQLMNNVNESQLFGSEGNTANMHEKWGSKKGIVKGQAQVHASIKPKKACTHCLGLDRQAFTQKKKEEAHSYTVEHRISKKGPKYIDRFEQEAVQKVKHCLPVVRSQ